MTKFSVLVVVRAATYRYDERTDAYPARVRPGGNKCYIKEAEANWHIFLRLPILQSPDI